MYTRTSRSCATKSGTMSCMIVFIIEHFGYCKHMCMCTVILMVMMMQLTCFCILGTVAVVKSRKV